jgi:uncharacterized protein
MSRPFLSARLQDVALVNYRVAADMLLPFVPAGCQLDTPVDDPDLHVVSVVGLRFADTRFLGLPAVMARSFPQLNLRCYVRHGSKHGVVFLRELVPKWLVSMGARTLFSQPYDVASLSHEVRRDGETIDVHTRVAYQGREGFIRVRGCGEPNLPEPGGHAEFLTARHWGFFRGRSGGTWGYQLEHQSWRLYTIESAEATIDPGMICGDALGVDGWKGNLHSVLLADGSVARLYRSEVIESG